MKARLLCSGLLSSLLRRFFANDPKRFEPFGTISPDHLSVDQGFRALCCSDRHTALPVVTNRETPVFGRAKPSSLSKRVKSSECHQPKCSLIPPIGLAFR